MAEPSRETDRSLSLRWSPESLGSLALAVVAGCTGYPEEMLGLDMDLEGDLGVDSIKRVEILSALRKQAPALPDVPAAELASKRSVRQIVAAYIESLNGTEPGSTRRDGIDSGAMEPGATEPAVLATEPAVLADPERWIVTAVPAAPPGLGTPGLFQGDGIVVTDEGSGIGAALVARLARHGARASLVDGVPEDSAAVIFLGGLREVRDRAQALAIQHDGFRVFQAVASRFGSRGGTLVTVQDTGGDFGLRGSERAWLAGLPGLAKTAAREWPRACVRGLDIERNGRSATEVADAIWHELRLGGADGEVGLTLDGRCVLEARPAPFAASPRGGAAVDVAFERAALEELGLGRGSVMVVTGGARGVTSACVIALAERLRCRFLLIGRTALSEEPESCRGLADDSALQRALLSEAQRHGPEITPGELRRRVDAVRAGREIRRTLAACEAAGAQARYESVDVGDAPQVRAVLARARERWGRIDGVVHGAGVRADKLIREQSQAEFERVFRSKVLGLEVLLAATEADDLRLVLSFSSVVARAGNPGQGAYALANEVLNKVAALEQRRRGARCRVRSLGFGPWDGGMVDAGLRAHFESLGVPLISMAAGARHFCRELIEPPPSGSEVIVGFCAMLAEAEPRELQRDVLVDREHYPFLDAHRVDGAVVLPVVLVLEWFGRAARAWWPDLRRVALRGVHVQRGIRLMDYDQGRSLRLCLNARVVGTGPALEVELELCGADGSRHYVATATAREAPRDRAPQAASSGVRSRFSGATYGPNALFHGPDFQVIEAIESVNEHGMVALLSGVAGRGWPGAWLWDVALLDGGLQLALLWARHLSGRAALPTAIGALHVDIEGAVRGPVRCLLTARETDGDRIVSDVILVDESGRTLAELRELETHLLPARARSAAVLVR